MYSDFTLFLANFISAMVCAYIAKQKGRDQTVWLAVGAITGFIGVILIAILPSLEEESSEHSVNRAEERDSTITLSTIATPVYDDLSQGMQKSWYYLDSQHQQFGPIPIEQLKNCWKEGRVKDATLVWSSGMAKWQPIVELPHLKLYLQS